MKKLIIIATLLSIFSVNARASCICQCINGQNQKFCDHRYELNTIVCPPKFCPNF